MQVALYALRSNRRALHVAEAMQQGLAAAGIKSPIRTDFRHGVEGDVAIAYGWSHEAIFRQYRHYLYFDLGYWGRTGQVTARDGYYRLAVNDWSPSINMLREMTHTRIRDIKISNQDDISRDKILIAAMSEKSAATHGYKFLQWEQDMLRRIGGRSAYVRHKPRKNQTDVVPIEKALREVKTVVTLHSNCVIDALKMGVPVYAERGVGVLFSVSFSEILRPPVLSECDRRQLLSDISWTQWTPQEMREGGVWEYASKILRKCETARESAGTLAI